MDSGIERLARLGVEANGLLEGVEHVANTTITATEMVENLPDVLRRLRRGGESFAVGINGDIVAETSPPERREPLTFRQLVDRLLPLHEPDADSAADVRAVREA